MKKLLLSITMLACIGMIGVNAQENLIISENFQMWDPTDDTDDSKCSAGVVLEYGITRELTLVTSTGIVEIPVTLYQCGIAPECESRRIEDGGATENLPGVTTGWVQLNKLTDGDTAVDIKITMLNMEDSPDTLGEFIFGPVPQIDSIVFAHSCTGANRGIRIYKSADGETWENASPDDEFQDGDSQLGSVHTVNINETDVYIKFTSGFRQADSTSQYSRLHNIDVWGTPGVLSSTKNLTEESKLSIYPVPAKDFIIIKLQDDATIGELQIIDVVGKTVYSSVVDRQSSRIDISNLNSGLYFIQITANNEKYVKKLLVK